MGVNDPATYALFRDRICQVIRKRFNEYDDWLAQFDRVVSSLMETGLADEIQAASPSYVTSFLDEVRQGLVDPFASGSEASSAVGALESCTEAPSSAETANEPTEESARALIDQLIASTRLYNTSDAIRELFEFTIRFRGFAPFNAMLLHIQKPGLTHAATAVDWRNRFGRVSIDGARPLLILRIMGPVDFVFDIQDTKGKKLPRDAFAFPTFGDMPETRFTRFTQAISSQKIDVVALDAGDGSAGWIELETRSASRRGKHRYKLAYNRNHPLPTRFVTIAHELAHLFLGHLGADGGRRVPDRRHIAPALREVEAEMTAYLVARRNGIQPRSERYLSKYQGAFNELDLYAVTRAANAVETALGISAHKLWKEKGLSR